MRDPGTLLEGMGPWGWTLFAASAFGLGGMLSALVTIVGLPFLIPAGIAGFTVGGILWWFAVESRRSTSSSTGVNVGTLTGLLSHFVMWFVDALWQYAELGASYTPSEFVRYVAIHVGVLSWASIIVTGIVTVAVGAFIGSRLVRLRRPSMEQASSEGGDHTGPE